MIVLFAGGAISTAVLSLCVYIPLRQRRRRRQEEMVDMLAYTMPMLPEEKPNHLLGIGDLPSIERCIPLGIDTFDSSYPTKAARHGVVFTKNGPLKLRHGKYKNHFGPIEEGCPCPTCSSYSVAYLHHLFKAREMTGMTLATIHNLHFLVNLMKEVREKIALDLI